MFYFLTFGGPTQPYHRAVERICREAASFSLFDVIIARTEKDLMADPAFWNQHGEFLSKNKRGYGYWLWKSYLILKTMKEMKENDILFYCDSGCELNLQGKARFLEYLQLLEEGAEDNLGFQLCFLEKTWTKMDTVLELGGEEHFSSEQLVGGIFFLKKNEKTMKLMEDAYFYSSQYHLLDDSPSLSPNDVTFREHRHDQSIFSILRKKHGGIFLPDETYFPSWIGKAESFPILAKRKIG
jgi:hypothetical protein